MSSMFSLILIIAIMIGGNTGYINRPAVVPDPTAANPTDFERERNIFLDNVDNITRIDETKNGETTQITAEIPPDTDFLKLNQYSRFDQWGLAYDKNGNLTQKGTQKMYPDYRNQIVRVTEGTTTTENKYDALGRRLQKIVNTGSQSKTENYYYSGHQVIEVRDGNDQVKRQFIYGNGIDEVIRMDVYNGSAITPYYFHTNEIGSTTAITDANGNVVERYKYGLYGMPTFMDAAGNVIPKSTIGNNILFQGREYEPETNFYYFRARHLDPIMGRFLQTDPMGYEDSLNLYQAFNQNPVNFVNPFGRNRDLIEGQKQSEIFDLESRLYELEIAISSNAVANNQAGMIRAYGEYLKLNEIYKQKTGEYFIKKKAGEPIMTPREAYAIVMGFTPAGDADDISLLFANYSILEGKKVKLNLLGKGVAVIGAAAPFLKTKHLLKLAKWLGLEKFLLKAQKKVSTKLVHLKERFKVKVTTGKGAFDFPEDPNVFTKQLGVEPKVSVTQHGTTRMVWEPNSNTRIRFESHPEGLIDGDLGFNPRHHGSHYHIEIKPDNMTWNQAKKQNLIKKIKPEDYVPGMGTGFLPFENLPGKVIEK